MEHLIEKLRRVLSNRFPRSVVELDEPNPEAKLGGALLWSGFQDDEQLDRQRQVNHVLRDELTRDERSQVSIIFTFTPEEAAVMREG